jgi:hypothetical protein
LPLIVRGGTNQLIIKALRRGIGHFMTAADLAYLVYGDHELKDAEQSVRAACNSIRPAVERAGWRLEGKNQVGYRLIPGEKS